MLYIRAVLRPGDCTRFGLTVKTNGKRDETSFTYDMADGTINGYTSNKGSEGSSVPVNGSLPLKDGKLEMEIFVDRSLVEGFFNADKSVSVRAYPKKKSQGLDLFAEGELEVEYLEVRRVGSIYE